MNFFCPFTIKWSPSRTAVVWMPATSLPWVGSVTARQMSFSPAITGRATRSWKDNEREENGDSQTRAFISAEPWCSTGGRAMPSGVHTAATMPPLPARDSSSSRISR